MVSILLSCSTYLYAIARSNSTLPEFFSELNKNQNNKITYIIYFDCFTLIFLIILIGIPKLLTSLFPKRPQIKHENFYILAHELNVQGIPSNKKVFILSKIDKNTILLYYYIKNTPVRITYPINELSKTKIFYEKEASFWQVLKQLNKTTNKKKLYLWFLPMLFILIVYTGISFILKDYNGLIYIIIGVFIGYLSLSFPIILQYLKILIKKAWLKIKDQNK